MDALHYSFELLGYYYSSLWETCCKIQKDNTQLVPALAGGCGFIEVVHRIREVSQSIPSLSHNHPEMRIFLSASSLAVEYRNYFQHLRNELGKNPPNPFPVWGSLSWVDAENPKLAHLALLGASMEGFRDTSCVYDRQEMKWVSKVTLGINNKSFHFDPVFDSATRFREFITSFLSNQTFGKIAHTKELPIVSFEIIAK